LHHLGHALWNLLTVLELEVEDLMRFESQAEFIKHCEEVRERFKAKREAAQRVTKPDDTSNVSIRQHRRDHRRGEKNDHDSITG
jgi:hypothetical protein